MWQLNVIIIYIKKKNVWWVLQCKGFFFLSNFVLTLKEKGLPKPLFNTFLFPSSFFPTVVFWPFSLLSHYGSWSVFLLLSRSVPSICSSWCTGGTGQAVSGVASGKHSSAAGPAALNRAGKGRLPQKVHGGSGAKH